MKRIFTLLLTVLISAFILTTPYASADSDPSDSLDNIAAVIAVSGNSVLLSNDIMLKQSDFQRYSGSSRVLKYGDVIAANVHLFLTTMPGQFAFDGSSAIKYLGTAEEHYKDSIKDLTVTDVNPQGSYIRFKDSKGNMYTWSTYADLGFFGFEPEIDSRNVNVGDVLRCAVQETGNIGKVILPVSVVSDSYAVLDSAYPGDANHDGMTTVRDCALIARIIANGRKNELEFYLDYNNDNKIDIRDVAAIARDLAKKK